MQLLRWEMARWPFATWLHIPLLGTHRKRHPDVQFASRERSKQVTDQGLVNRINHFETASSAWRAAATMAAWRRLAMAVITATADGDGDGHALLLLALFINGFGPTHFIPFPIMCVSVSVCACVCVRTSFSLLKFLCLSFLFSWPGQKLDSSHWLIVRSSRGKLFSAWHSSIIGCFRWKRMQVHITLGSFSSVYRLTDFCLFWGRI